MIMSGWILPDLYEVRCHSCSTLNGHIAVVKQYLNALKLKDVKNYNRIITAFEEEASVIPLLGLDDFAVIKLGWIKVNNEPVNILFCTDNCKLDFLIKRYTNLGFSLVVLKESRPTITIDIPSQELI